jgi:hypothetical protein
MVVVVGIVPVVVVSTPEVVVGVIVPVNVRRNV